MAAERKGLEYAPAPESTAVVHLREQYGLFIGGAFVSPRGGSWFKTVNPASEEVLAEVAEAGEDDVDRAVRAARDAAAGWQKTPARERAKVIYRVARALQERARATR